MPHVAKGKMDSRFRGNDKMVNRFTPLDRQKTPSHRARKMKNKANSFRPKTTDARLKTKK